MGVRGGTEQRSWLMPGQAVRLGAILVACMLTTGVGVLIAYEVLTPVIGIVALLGPILVLLAMTFLSPGVGKRLAFMLYLLFVLSLPTVRALLPSSSMAAIIFNVLPGVSDLIMALFLLMAILEFGRAGTRLQWTAMDLGVIAILLLAVYGSVLSREPVLILYGMRMTYLPMAAYLATRLFRQSRADLWFFIHVILGVGLIVAILGVAIYFFTPYQTDVLWREQYGGVVGARAGVYRMTSVFWAGVPFGSFMAICSTLGLALALRPDLARGQKVFYWTVHLMGLFCAVFSMARGAWLLALSGSVVAVVLIRPGGRMINILILLGTLVLVVNLVIPLGYTGPYGRGLFPAFRLFSGFETAISGRSDQWEAAIELFQNRPLGVGLGKAGHVGSRFGGQYGLTHATVPDGWYFKVLVEAGILGFVAWLVFTGMLVAQSWRLAKSQPEGPERYLVAGMAGVFIGVAGECIGGNVWDFGVVAPLLWLLVGLFVRLARSDFQEPMCRSAGLPVAGLHSLSQPASSPPALGGARRRVVRL